MFSFITYTAIGLVVTLIFAIVCLIKWQFRSHRFMPVESALCLGMGVLIFEIVTKFLI